MAYAGAADGVGTGAIGAAITDAGGSPLGPLVFSLDFPFNFSMVTVMLFFGY